MMKNFIYLLIFLFCALFEVNAQTNTIFTQPITSTKPYLGEVSSAMLQIDDANSDGEITNPLIVVEGFDSGLLNPEDEFGEKNITSFIRSVNDADSDDLETFLTGGTNIVTGDQDYDIIYVNWDNGRDYLQRNAYLLEDIIDWVNGEKVGDEPNVVLGQSMGGVIARYALRDMEINGDDHDTRLYISHDAPHQGANIPLGFMYFAKHITQSLIGTPAGGININPNDNGKVRLQDLHNLLYAPGTQQLLMPGVANAFYQNTAINQAWYDELQNDIDYPQQTRNIAISNGSHCANPQPLLPEDELLSIIGTADTRFLTDIISMLFGTIDYTLLAFFSGVPSVILNTFPGSNHFDASFKANALPINGNSKVIYKGSLVYTKKLFWVISIPSNLISSWTITATSGQCYEYYPGGSYELPLELQDDDFKNALISYGYNVDVTESYGFIPTASALDIGNGTYLNLNDYFISYNINNVPTNNGLNTPFNNFTSSISDNDNLNEAHISFNTRNGNWLAIELDADQTNPDYPPVVDCSFDCNNEGITGMERFCIGSQTYTLPQGYDTYTWSMTGYGATITSTTHTNAITITKDANVSGWVTIMAEVESNACNVINNFIKKVYVGTPTHDSITEVDLLETGLSQPFSDADSCGDFGLKLNIHPGPQEILEVEWEKVSQNFVWNHTNTNYAIVNPDCDEAIDFKVRYRNNCGWSNWYNLSYTFGECSSNCGGSGGSIESDDFVIYPVPADNNFTVALKNQQPGLLQNGDTLNIKLYNNMGSLQYNIDAVGTHTQIDVSGYNPGFYVLLITYNGIQESHQINII